MSKPWYGFSDQQLGLQAKWFTGKEWAEGTAERKLREEFYRAVEKAGSWIPDAWKRDESQSSLQKMWL